MVTLINQSERKKMNTLKIEELKKDLAHYQRMIPEAINMKKQAKEDGRVLFANSLDNKIAFFRKQSSVLKATINKMENEVQSCQVS